MSGAAVYRMYDEDADLLYVGCSIHWPTRLAQHAAEKSWWNDVARITVEHHASRETAAAAEAAAIRDELPPRNVLGLDNPAEIQRRRVERERETERRRVERHHAETYPTAGKVVCGNCGHRPARMPKGAPVTQVMCPECEVVAFGRGGLVAA